jgi:glycosyltransferase involved in cell wall biosynthesis
MKQSVMSYYPLTAAFKERIESLHGPVERYLPVGKVRNLSLLKILSHLRQLDGDRLLIAIEHSDSKPLFGPLRLVAMASKAASVSVVLPDGSIEPMPLSRLTPIIYSLVKDQLAARIYLRKMLRRAKSLCDDRKQQNFNLSSTRQVVFLDANLSFGLSAGGSLGHIKGVVDSLSNHGFGIRYLSTKPMPTDKEGVEYVHVSPPSMLAFPAELNYYLHHQEFDRVASNAISQTPVDFIYQRMSLHNFSGVELARKFDVPLVLEYNGSEAWTAENWGHKLALHEAAIVTENTALQQADLLVTVSEALETELQERGIPSDRIVTYPNCVDPEIFSPERFDQQFNMSLRESLGIPPTALVATFIGTFGAWHGVDFLAHVIRHLLDNDRDFIDRHNLHFLIIGDGLQKPEVERLVGVEPYRRYVSLPGLVPQNQAPGYLAVSNLFLSPHLPNADGSAFFGSPTKLFEYMAMEKPIIASDLDQIGKILKSAFFGPSEGQPLGYLFEPGSVEDMIRALRSAIENPEESKEIAKRARKYVLSHFTWYNHVEAILKQLELLGLVRRQSRTSATESTS